MTRASFITSFLFSSLVAHFFCDFFPPFLILCRESSASGGRFWTTGKMGTAEVANQRNSDLLATQPHPSHPRQTTSCACCRELNHTYDRLVTYHQSHDGLNNNFQGSCLRFPLAARLVALLSIRLLFVLRANEASP